MNAISWTYVISPSRSIRSTVWATWSDSPAPTRRRVAPFAGLSASRIGLLTDFVIRLLSGVFFRWRKRRHERSRKAPDPPGTGEPGDGPVTPPQQAQARHLPPRSRRPETPKLAGLGLCITTSTTPAGDRAVADVSFDILDKPGGRDRRPLDLSAAASSTIFESHRRPPRPHPGGDPGRGQAGLDVGRDRGMVSRPTPPSGCGHRGGTTWSTVRAPWGCPRRSAGSGRTST